MSLNVSLLPALPTPPTKTDPANFASRADTFLSALPNFGESLNTIIQEINKITSGLDQQTPIAAYNSTTTYSFPDTVAGSDGHTYRCVDVGVIGIDPVGNDGTKWLGLTKPTNVDKILIIGNAGTSLTLEANVYDTFSFTCDQSVLNLATTSLPLGRTITLIITGGNDCTITWLTGTQWPGGSVPSLSAGTDRVVMQRISPTTIHATVAGMSYA